MPDQSDSSLPLVGRRGIFKFMAQRRMFSPKIVSSDAFLDMPGSSQLLYFHLGMYADDDGFVNPRFVMRLCGASEDDLKILIAKRFVLPFESGVVVIKHWKINNLVRKDWYQPTIYEELKKQLKIKENGAYTELVNEPLTVRQHRLGKVRLDKVSLEEREAHTSKKPDFKNLLENEEEQKKVLQWLIEKGVSEDLAKKELLKFIAYWSEPSSTGKLRYQAQKFFDINRRLITWFSRINNFNGTPKKGTLVL